MFPDFEAPALPADFLTQEEINRIMLAPIACQMPGSDDAELVSARWQTDMMKCALDMARAAQGPAFNEEAAMDELNDGEIGRRREMMHELHTFVLNQMDGEKWPGPKGLQKVIENRLAAVAKLKALLEYRADEADMRILNQDLLNHADWRDATPILNLPRTLANYAAAAKLTHESMAAAIKRQAEFKATNDGGSDMGDADALTELLRFLARSFEESFVYRHSSNGRLRPATPTATISIKGGSGPFVAYVEAALGVLHDAAARRYGSHAMMSEFDALRRPRGTTEDDFHAWRKKVARAIDCRHVPVSWGQPDQAGAA